MTTEQTDKLVERLNRAIDKLNPLTGKSEDYIWRPADRARSALLEARDEIERLTALLSQAREERDGLQHLIKQGLMIDGEFYPLEIEPGDSGDWSVGDYGYGPSLTLPDAWHTDEINEAFAATSRSLSGKGS